MNIFSQVMNALKKDPTAGPRIMPGAAGELLASMGLTEIGPHQYHHHVFVDAYRKSPKNYSFPTPYGPVCMPIKQAKKMLKDRERAARGRFVGPFPTYGKKARLAMESAQA